MPQHFKVIQKYTKRICKKGIILYSWRPSHDWSALFVHLPHYMGRGNTIEETIKCKGQINEKKYWNFIVSIKILSIITIWTCSVQIVFQRQGSLNGLHAVPQLRHLFGLSGFFGLDFSFQESTLIDDNFHCFPQVYSWNDVFPGTTLKLHKVKVRYTYLALQL